MVLVVTVPMMVSEGKTMASDGMEIDSSKNWCGKATQGALRFRQGGGRVGAKMGGVWP